MFILFCFSKLMWFIEIYLCTKPLTQLMEWFFFFLKLSKNYVIIFYSRESVCLNKIYTCWMPKISFKILLKYRYTVYCWERDRKKILLFPWIWVDSGSCWWWHWLFQTCKPKTLSVKDKVRINLPVHDVF